MSPTGARKDVKKYAYYDPKLREDAYATGDIYSKEKIDWEIPSSSTKRPYLAHVKSLSSTWPSLRLLADFMEVTTSPMRWKDIKTNEQKRNERASRTNVTRLDYLVSGKVVPQSYKTPEALETALNEQTVTDKDSKRKFRVFIVEDLSRDVIELLGAHLDIEPAFFREQIFDYTWYNTRDRWVDPPRLNIVTKRQRWLQLRFTTARYFKTAESFKQVVEEYKSFNVLRRPEDDLNNKALWDEKDAIVGLTRTRASFWLGSTDGHQGGPVGVLLVDPTAKEGFPLWYGYRNWEETPSMHEKCPPRGPPRGSLYSDVIDWAQKPVAFQSQPTADPASDDSDVHIPIQALLYIVSSEWLQMSEYIRTRLGQIEWEISFPEHFLNKGSDIDIALKKLHVWRRLVPLYREMLTETLQRVFQFPCHPTGLTSSATSLGMNRMSNNNSNDPIAVTASGGDSASSTSSRSCQCPVNDSNRTGPGPINALRDDFARILLYMEEYQQRIDRLTSVVTAIISIADSRRSQADNKNVARLTWLATFFIPLSFIATLFSMQEDIGKLQETIKWYFAAAVPLACLSLGFTFLLALPSVHRFGSKIARGGNDL
ncbi:Uncharacterized protein BP5553_03286 [Venustampulla echinocandica]|uniref:Uncharacterized protein n=1 Tax=Venustampulla echinocandica TaxID=2656787 RepID=A0A370TTT6_9HELO|nr:Uncharacterized protein BP5553_03286 [Venustampulla echinocandica]RDL38946.1 Uncharacterized protein BP5553_03286 [Venustampulla echinocandica]